MNGIEWMLQHVNRGSFPEQVSDPVAWEAAEREYRNAILNVRLTIKRRNELRRESEKRRGAK